MPFQGLEIVFRVGLTLLQVNQTELMQLDMEGMSQYFQRVIPHQFDSCPDKLILKAYQVKYNPKKMKRSVPAGMLAERGSPREGSSLVSPPLPPQAGEGVRGHEEQGDGGADRDQGEAPGGAAGTNAPGSVLPLWGRRPLGGGPAPRYPASAAEGSALRPPQPVSDGSRGLETRR